MKAPRVLMPRWSHFCAPKILRVAVKRLPRIIFLLNSTVKFDTRFCWGRGVCVYSFILRMQNFWAAEISSYTVYDMKLLTLAYLAR